MLEASIKLVDLKRKGLSEHLLAHGYAEKITSNEIHRAILRWVEYTSKPDKQQRQPENKQWSF